MVFGMAQPERPRRRPQPSNSHVHVRTQMLDFESAGGVVMKSSLPCLEPPCEGVTNPCRTSQACRCRSFPFLSRPRLARRIPDSYVISGDFATLWEASRPFPSKRMTTSESCCGTSSGTRCGLDWWSGPRTGLGPACERSLAAERSRCSIPVRYRADRVGWKRSTRRCSRARCGRSADAFSGTHRTVPTHGFSRPPPHWAWNPLFVRGAAPD